MASDFASAVAHYGYIAAFVGPLLEGETFLVLAGVAARRGHLALPLLMVAGAVCASARRQGPRRLFDAGAGTPF
jgi:membrane protein DedA with SNARE-associated domain